MNIHNHKTFFNQIGTAYGEESKSNMKRVLVIKKKLASLRTRKDFLIEYRRHKLVPKSLQINLKRFAYCMDQRAMNELTINFSKQLTNAAIRKLFIEIN